ncbi:WD40-repeat-containing domain protein [Parasitella parasitica]|nr:WD40-repeat-containing domain protein [Parasitella parasitica]
MSVPSQQGDTPIGSPNRLNMPSNANVNQMLQTYFQKKGFNQAELAFIQQQSVASEHNVLSLEQLAKKFNAETGSASSETLPDYIKMLRDDPHSGAGDLDAPFLEYQSLREWIHSALDLYKTDLCIVLYPAFVHIFLHMMSKRLVDHEIALDFFKKYKDDHAENHHKDLETLQEIRSPNDVGDNVIAKLYLNNKYNIRIPSIPFELFFQYIQDNRFMNLIRIVNQYLNIHIVTSKLSLASASGSAVAVEEGIAGHANNQLDAFHQATSVALSRGQNSDEDAIDLNKVKEEATLELMQLDDIAAVPYRSTDIQAELDSLSDLRKRVSMGSAALPSVCIYTFHNTHDMLNCISISEDTTLVAGGFSESYIKVWSLQGKKLLSKSEKDQHQPGTICKKLIGHAGPVYGLSFSHDNQYLISCSEDQTVRLWSLESFTNLVCYKSHNYPIWDVEFGPHGFYFATASLDKTARLWSCDHVNPLRIFAGHLSDVNTVRFHPNSKYIVTGSSDNTARLWDVQRGTCVRVFTGHTGSVHAVAISPNGRLMASGGEDQSIMLWDLGSGKRLKTMTGHTGFIYTVSFNSESTVLVSGGADGTVRAWDVKMGTPYEHANEIPDLKKSKYDKANGKQQSDKKEMDKAKSTTDMSKRKKGSLESNDHLTVLHTKHTPVYTVQFTQRNLCLAAGALSSPSLDL